MVNKITIKQEALLPTGFKIFGGLMAFMGVALVVIQFNLLTLNFKLIGILFILIGIVMIIGGLILITAHTRLTIDPESKTYHIYPWLLGYQTGEPEKFNYIESFYIKKVRLKQNSHSKSAPGNSAPSSPYKAFMKLDNGEKIYLDTDSNPEKLEMRMAEYQQKLKHVLSV